MHDDAKRIALTTYVSPHLAALARDAARRSDQRMGLEDQLERVLHRQLTGILGPHLVPQPEPKPKRVRKAATKPQKPDGVSQEVWDTIEAQRIERRRKQGRECYRRSKQREGARTRATDASLHQRARSSDHGRHCIHEWQGPHWSKCNARSSGSRIADRTKCFH